MLQPCMSGKGVIVRHLVKFEVGEHYNNRKGKYEVLGINGDAMHIRWKVGEEVITSVALQSRIVDNMQQELERLALNKVAAPQKKSAVSRG